MTKRTVIIAVSAAGLAALTGVLVWRSLDLHSGSRGSAGDEARAACARADTFISLVDRNAAAADVRAALADATALATRAASLDPVWAPLRSGLETFAVALDNDDAGAANVAVRVVRGNCRAFEATG